MPPQTAPKNNMMLILVIGAAVSVVISVAVFTVMKGAGDNKNKLNSLEDTIKIQDNKINDLSTLIHNNKSLTDSQISAMKTSLENDSKDHYNNLKEAIQDDKQEINFLDDLTKKIDQKIEAIAASNSQPQNAATP